MSCCEQTVIQKVKVIATGSDFVINNGLNLNSNTIQLGGPLVSNTDISGNYTLNLGTIGSRLSQLNLRTTGQLLLDYNDGTNNITLALTSSGVAINDASVTTQGIYGNADFSTRYTSLSYVQKTYTDSHLIGKPVSSVLQTPTVTQDGYFIKWDNTAGDYTLVPGSSASAGTTTQVIFNTSGTLGGSANFTFSTTILSIGDTLNMGTLLSTTNRVIAAQGSVANIGLELDTKGTGNFVIGLGIGSNIIVGQSTNTSTKYTISTQGTQSEIDINIAGKGTNAILYVGDLTAAGSFRYITAIGNTANTNLVLSSQGQGHVILEAGNNDTGFVLIGLATDNVSNRTIKVQTSASNANLTLSPIGSSGKVLIGDASQNYSDYYLETIGVSANRNLRISSIGTGRVVVDGYAIKVISIGDWNMNATQNVAISHGVTNGHTTIVSVRVKIYEDGGTQWHDFISPYTTSSGGGATLTSILVDTSNVYLQQSTTAGNGFRTTVYDSTGFNRGFIEIRYTI